MRYPWIILVALTLAPIASWAELSEVARKDHAEAFAAAAAPTAEKYNFKLGPVTTDLGSRFEVEYNDNISQTPTAQVDDTILRAALTSTTRWPITEINSLSLDLDLGYRWYLDNNKLNSNKNFLDVNPGSELALKWRISNFEFKLYDQLSYLVDSADIRVFDISTATVVSNLVDFGRIENRAGLETMWDLNDLKVYFGYSRDDVKADKNDFKSYNRVRHTIYGTPIFQVNPEFSVGWLNSYSWNMYQMQEQNDSRVLLTGPSLFWQATASSSIAWDVYWQKTWFDTNGTNGDDTSFSGLNTEATYKQQINEYLAHSLSLSRLTSIGSISNTTTTLAARYEPTYQLKDNLALKGRAAYEDGKDSGGLYQESFIRRIYGAGFTYYLSTAMTVDGFYSYINQTSDVESRNYKQNKVTLSLTYDF